MKIETDYITRTLYYSTIQDDWLKILPKDNWCLIIISNNDNEQVIDKIISESISNNVAYICGIGKKHDYIHNQADSEYVIRDIGESEHPKPKYHIITVGDEYLDEGLWFGLNLTFNGDIEIDRIQIVDTDCKWKNEIEKLLRKFKEGYLPDEE